MSHRSPQKKRQNSDAHRKNITHKQGTAEDLYAQIGYVIGASVAPQMRSRRLHPVQGYPLESQIRVARRLPTARIG